MPIPIKDQLVIATIALVQSGTKPFIDNFDAALGLSAEARTWLFTNFEVLTPPAGSVCCHVVVNREKRPAGNTTDPFTKPFVVGAWFDGTSPRENLDDLTAEIMNGWTVVDPPGKLQVVWTPQGPGNPTGLVCMLVWLTKTFA